MPVRSPTIWCMMFFRGSEAAVTILNESCFLEILSQSFYITSGPFCKLFLIISYFHICFGIANEKKVLVIKYTIYKIFHNSFQNQKPTYWISRKLPKGAKYAAGVRHRVHWQSSKNFYCWYPEICALWCQVRNGFIGGKTLISTLEY